MQRESFRVLAEEMGEMIFYVLSDGPCTSGFLDHGMEIIETFI